MKDFDPAANDIPVPIIKRRFIVPDRHSAEEAWAATEALEQELEPSDTDGVVKPQPDYTVPPERRDQPHQPPDSGSSRDAPSEIPHAPKASTRKASSEPELNAPLAPPERDAQPIQPTTARKMHRWFFATAAAVIIASGLWFSDAGQILHSAEPLAQITNSQGSYTRNNRAHKEAVEIFQGDTLSTAAGGVLAIRLGDHTVVTLDENTEVALLAEDVLKVANGRVYIDSPNPNSAILVSTPFGDIVDIGTRYAVTVAPESLNVAMREGVAKVTTPAATLYASVTNGLGDVISIDKDANVETRHLATADEQWQWTQKAIPDFDLYSASIQELLQWSSRVTGKEIIYVTESAQKAAQQTHLPDGQLSTDAISQQLPEILKTAALIVEERRNAFVIATTPIDELVPSL
ncbi:MAG TPA: FecR family protein [Marinagarivorans sp.]